MTYSGVLLAGRRAAEALMVDECTVRTVTGRATDPTTGKGTPTYSAPLYLGKCRVQSFQPQERSPEAGGATLTVQRYAVHVPVEAFAPAVGQVITITAAAGDANLVGRQYRVVALLHKSLATAYRLSVEEVA